MLTRIFGLKTLGLCILVIFSVMVGTAANAQAKGHVFVNLTLLNNSVLIEASEFIHGELLSTIGLFNKKVQILCEKISIVGLVFASGGGSGEAEFSECQLLLNLEFSACDPLEPIVSSFKALLIHHNGDTYILFSPAVGTVFTTLHFGPECAIGQNIEVSGNLVAECGLLLPLEALIHWTHEDCNVERESHEIQQVPGTLFSNALKFGSRAANLHGDVSLDTNGFFHAGAKWSLQALL